VSFLDIILDFKFENFTDLSQSTDEHVHLANAIIPTFEDLMIKFQTNKSCLKHLIEILQFINYGCCRSDHLSHVR
jgi:hypothetical protein